MATAKDTIIALADLSDADVHRIVRQTVELCDPTGTITARAGQGWRVNMATRVLTYSRSFRGRPLSDDEYRYLCVHESGHLLWSHPIVKPSGKDWNAYRSIWNACEDMRSERQSMLHFRGFKRFRNRIGYKFASEAYAQEVERIVADDDIVMASWLDAFAREYGPKRRGQPAGLFYWPGGKLRNASWITKDMYAAAAACDTMDDMMPHVDAIYDALFPPPPPSEDDDGDGDTGEDGGDGDGESDNTDDNPGDGDGESADGDTSTDDGESGTDDGEDTSDSPSGDPGDDTTDDTGPDTDGDTSAEDDGDDTTGDDKVPGGPDGDTPGDDDADDTSGDTPGDTDGEDGTPITDDDASSDDTSGDDGEDGEDYNPGGDADASDDDIGNDGADSDTPPGTGTPDGDGTEDDGEDMSPVDPSNVYEDDETNNDEVDSPDDDGVANNYQGLPVATDGSWQESIDAPSRGGLARILAGMLRRNENAENVRGKRSGRFDSKRATRLVSGADTRVFKKRQHPGESRYMLIITPDVSGSMSEVIGANPNRPGVFNTRGDLTIRAVATLCEAWRRSGQPFHVAGWCGHLSYYVTDKSTRQELDTAYTRRQDGSDTQEHIAVQYALRVACRAFLDGYQPLWLHITDGESGSGDQESLDTFVKLFGAGHVYWIGAGSGARSRYTRWPNTVTINDMDELLPYMQNVARRQVMRETIRTTY